MKDFYEPSATEAMQLRDIRFFSDMLLVARRPIRQAVKPTLPFKYGLLWKLFFAIGLLSSGCAAGAERGPKDTAGGQRESTGDRKESTGGLHREVGRVDGVEPETAEGPDAKPAATGEEPNDETMVWPKKTGAQPARPAKPVLHTLEVKEKWGSRIHRRTFRVTVDLSQHKLLLNRVGMAEKTTFPDEHFDLCPTLSHVPEEKLKNVFMSAAVLGFKAKQFDDGLVAAVELAADRGMGRFPSRAKLAASLAYRLSRAQSPKNKTHDIDDNDTDAAHDGASILAAGAMLGGSRLRVNQTVTEKARKHIKEFLKDERESKVIGFYTWSRELSRIFQRDRFLQQPLVPAAAQAVARSLAGDPKLMAAYKATLELNEKLTNDFRLNDLRSAADALKKRDDSLSALHPPVAFFPPTRSYETDLMTRLYGDGSIPEGFDLSKAMIKWIQDGASEGKERTKPGKNSGWYDYITHAFTPLVIPDRMQESVRLRFSKSYKKELEELFKALLALTRETHTKSMGAVGYGHAPGTYVVELELRPWLSIEPLATHYLRRAKAYRFVRRELVKSFGESALKRMRRRTPAGTVRTPLLNELLEMEDLFFGAYAQVMHEIGLPVETHADLGSRKGPGAARKTLARFRSNLAKDPDVGRDFRMMVPVYHDEERGKTKVWVVMGLVETPIAVGFERAPRVVSVHGESGEKLGEDEYNVEMEREDHVVYRIAMAEVYVTRLLNRKEFRALCDKYKNAQDILMHLE